MIIFVNLQHVLQVLSGMVDEGDKVYSESFHLVENRTLDDKAPDYIVGFEVSQASQSL